MNITRPSTESGPHSNDDEDVFSVQLYADDGRLLSEYALYPEIDDVLTLDAAEAVARSNMVENDLGSTTIVISQESPDKLRQVQITIADELA